MLDVDGTLVPYDYDALPSERVAEAIQRVQKKVTVCLVTGRSYPFTKPVIKRLGLRNGFAVVNVGSHVIKLETEEVLYDQPIDPQDVKTITSILHEENVVFFAKQDLHQANYIEHPVTKDMKLKKAYMFFSDANYSSEKIDRILHKLSKLSHVVPYKARHKEGFGINVSHVDATKLHGVEVIMKELKLKREEIIGIGDGYNDFPLLMASGFKVAMGNAVDDLKAIADYIAPTVEEDGVADVVQKFILS